MIREGIFKPIMAIHQHRLDTLSNMRDREKHNHGEVTRRGAIVAALLRFEAVMVISLAVYLTLKSISSHPEAPMALAMEILFALLGGLGLMAAAHGFARARNYGRAPAVLANLIALGVSIFQFQAHLWLLAAPLALLALITAGLALSIIPE